MHFPNWSSAKPLVIMVVLAFACLVRSQTAVAADFALVADRGTAVAAWTARLQSNNTVAVFTFEDATALTVTDWAHYRIVWLLAAAPDTSTDAPAHGWRDLTSPFGELAKWVGNGGHLVITAPQAVSINLDVSPSGAAFRAHSSTDASASSIQQANHPLVSGEGYSGVQLTASDFNQATPAGQSSGCWIKADDSTVIAADGHGPTVAEIRYETGRILLVGVSVSPSSGLVGNLIGYTLLVAP